MQPLSGRCGGVQMAAVNTVSFPRSSTTGRSRSITSDRESTSALPSPVISALSCFRCNSFKGSDISGRDSKTGKLTALFNPRRHKWTRHFHWQGAYLIGRTPTGRVTIAVLRINDPFRVELRELLIEEGVFPPA